jgi:hypothetical protein
MKKMITVFILLIILVSLSGKFSADLETGVIFPGYNDVRIPNAPEDNSTFFSFKDDFDADPVMFGRLNLHWQIHPRHELSLLAAPLTLKPTGTLPDSVVFMGTTFEANTPIEGRYTFNSYRAQYLYRFKNQKQILRAIGVTIKLRDAVISLKQGDTYAEKTDLAPVPLIGIELGYDFNDDFSILLKGEGLWSPYGRAEDFLLSARYNINDKSTLYLGYRFLEGGSDIDEVLTFASLNYLTIGTQIRF